MQRSPRSHQEFSRHLLVIAALALVGCVTPIPRVQYHHFDRAEEDLHGWIKFHLTETNLVLGREAKPNSKSEKDKFGIQLGSSSPVTVRAASPVDAFKDVVVAASPAEGSELYAIVPRDYPFLKTRLSVTYFSNSRILKTIGSEVEDTRLKAITAAASIAGAAVKFGILSEQGQTQQLTLPVVIPVQKALETSENGWIQLPKHTRFWYRINTKPIDQDKALRDAVPAQEFFSTYSVSLLKPDARVLGFSACREGTLHLRYDAEPPKATETEGPIQFPITFADSRFLQTRTFPTKGAITMHSVCGADSSSEKAAVASTAELVDEFFKQVKAIREAQDQERKSKETPGGKKPAAR